LAVLRRGPIPWLAFSGEQRMLSPVHSWRLVAIKMTFEVLIAYA
jgi:hypothetical protein